MVKIGRVNEESTSENTQESLWTKQHLALVDGNADSWFQAFGVAPASEVYAGRFETGKSLAGMLSHVARSDLNLVADFEVDEDAYGGTVQAVPETTLGKAIQASLDSLGVSMGYKTRWAISHEQQVELDVQRRLEGQWATEKGTPFVQALEIFRDKDGKEIARWFVDLLVSPVPVASFNEFEVPNDDGDSLTTYAMSTENGKFSVGELSTKLQLPVFLKNLAYMSETPFPSTQIMTISRDIAFSKVPSEARPKPFFTIAKNAEASGYSRSRSSSAAQGRDAYQGSLFPDVVRFGWTMTESSIPFLDEVLSVLVNGCTNAMSTVEDGYTNYRNLDYPAPWDDVLGSPCSKLVSYAATGSRSSAPQWIPVTHIGDILAQSELNYREGSLLLGKGKKQQAEQRFRDVIHDGAGPFLVHAINTFIYSYLLPELIDNPELISEVEYLAEQALSLEMADQSTNALSNLGIAYYLAGALDESANALDAALNRKDGFAEAEASFFMAQVEIERDNQTLAARFQERCTRAGGYQYPADLPRPR